MSSGAGANVGSGNFGLIRIRHLPGDPLKKSGFIKPAWVGGTSIALFQQFGTYLQPREEVLVDLELGITFPPCVIGQIVLTREASHDLRLNLLHTTLGTTFEQESNHPGGFTHHVKVLVENRSLNVGVNLGRGQSYFRLIPLKCHFGQLVSAEKAIELTSTTAEASMERPATPRPPPPPQQKQGGGGVSDVGQGGVAGDVIGAEASASVDNGSLGAGKSLAAAASSSDQEVLQTQEIAQGRNAGGEGGEDGEGGEVGGDGGVKMSQN